MICHSGQKLGQMFADVSVAVNESFLLRVALYSYSGIIVRASVMRMLWFGANSVHFLQFCAIV